MVQRGWHEFSGGGEQDRGVDRFRGESAAPPTEVAPSVRASLGLRAAGEHVHGGALGEGDLRGETRTGSETIDGKAPVEWQVRSGQRPPADDAGGRWPELSVGVPAGQWVGVVGGCRSVVGVARRCLPAAPPRTRQLRWYRIRRPRRRPHDRERRLAGGPVDHLR